MVLQYQMEWARSMCTLLIRPKCSQTSNTQLLGKRDLENCPFNLLRDDRLEVLASVEK